MSFLEDVYVILNIALFSNNKETQNNLKCVSKKYWKFCQKNANYLKTLFVEKVIIKGDEYYYLNNVLHQENDLPAVIKANGTRLWYKFGKLHRDNNEPAIIDCSRGLLAYYKMDEPYRENNKPTVINCSMSYF
jgi:hypothetical protein